MSLIIKAQGACDLIVDEGRIGYRHQGLPWGGPADPDSFQIANALLGNAINTPALEISLAGPTLNAQADIALSLYGAPFSALIDGVPIGQGSFTLRKKQSLQIQSCKTGMRAYLAVKGGIHWNKVLGSQSGLAPLKKGMVLPCCQSKVTRRTLPQEWEWNAPTCRLRVLTGPESGWFPKDFFAGNEFIIQTASNRMGLRLKGKPVPQNGKEMLSEPVCPGTVQVAKDGQLLVLGVDGQTIGGYPRIAQVIRADLPILGQLQTGKEVVFSLVSLEEAQQAELEKNKRLNSLVLRLQTAATDFF